MIDRVTFSTQIDFLFASYPQARLQPQTIEVFYQVLGDLDLALLKAAILSWVSCNSAWPPSAGQLRTHAFELIDQTRGAITPGEAWAETLKKINSYDPPSRDDFSDPIAYDALEAIGGNRVLCATMEETLHTARARYIQAFEQLKKRQRTDERMLPAVRQLAHQLTAGAERTRLDDGRGDVEPAK